MIASAQDSSAIDTAQLPTVVPGRVPAPARRDLRAERRHERRVRRVSALGGLAVLAALLAATVFVLDVVR